MSRYARELWHTFSVDECELKLKTDRAKGLTPQLSRKRLERLGRNELFLPEQTSYSSCARVVFSDPSLLLLLLICVIALCFSRWNTVIAVLCVLLISCAITLLAYHKTCRIREAMSAYGAPGVRIIRAGRLLYAEATSVVPGDLIVLQRGDVAPCDLRLISDDALLVLPFFHAEDEQVRPISKSAQVTYTAADAPLWNERANMLYAGDTVVKGSAYAFAVSTGEDTHIGSLMGATALASKTGEIPELTRIRRYFNRYSLIMCALLLPIVMLGLIVGGGSLQIFDVFFVALAVVVASMSEQLIVIGRIVASSGILRSALKHPISHAVILKHYDMLDSISRAQDFFLIGMEAISDGKPHPHAVYTSKKLYQSDQRSCDEVARLYTLLYLYRKGTEASNSLYAVHGDQDSSAILMLSLLRGARELERVLAFDTEAIDIRTRSLALGAGGVDVSLPYGKETVRRYSVFSSLDTSMLEKCVTQTVGRRTEPLGEADAAYLADIYKKLTTQGNRMLVCVTKRDDLYNFEGMVAFREAVDPDLQDKIAALEMSHTKATLILPREDIHHMGMLLQSGWISSEREIVRASALPEIGMTLPEAYESAKVLIGFSDGELTELLQACHAKKRTTAVLAMRNDYSAFISTAQIKLAYDNRPFSSDPIEDPKPTTVQEAHDYRKERSDDALRLSADACLRRADGKGGPVDGMLCAIHTARGIRRNMMLMLQYLLVAQFLRISLVLIPLLFGTIALPAPLIILSGLWIDLAYILILAFCHCSKEDLQHIPRDRKFFASPISARPDWIVAAIGSGILITITGAILRLGGSVAPGNGYELYTFLSLIAVQTTAILLFTQSYGPVAGPSVSYITKIAILFLVLLSVALIALIPGLSSVFSCGGISWLVLLLSPLSSVYFIGIYVLSRSFRAKIVDFIRTTIEKKFYREEQ